MYNTRDANFLTRNLTFSGKLAISPSIYSDWRRKSRHFDGGRHVSSLGVPCTTLSTTVRFVDAFGQAFLVIFTTHTHLIHRLAINYQV